MPTKNNSNRLHLQPSVEKQHIEPGSDSDEEEFAVRRRGFSSEYLSLAKKFKIKLVSGSQLTARRRPYDASKLHNLRIKTQFSKEPYTELMEPLTTLKLHEVLMDSSKDSKELHTNSRSFKINQPFFRNRASKAIQAKSFYSVNKSTAQQGQAGDKEAPLLKLETSAASIEQFQRLSYHSRKLLAICEHLHNVAVEHKQTIKQVRQYILNEERSSISRLDCLFVDPNEKRDIKMVVCLERVILISVVDHLSRKKISLVREAAVLCLEAVNGFYLSLIRHAYEQRTFSFELNNNSPIKKYLSKLEEKRISSKHDLSALLKFLTSKLPRLFTSNGELYDSLKRPMQTAKTSNINRTFYNILTVYAQFINDTPQEIYVNAVSFFATCPSPYILKPPTRKYFLVMDLDETLLHSEFKNGAYETKLRPHCNEFLEELSLLYEIIVFTSSNESYAREATKQISRISHYLFRQHAIRVSGGFIKDIARIGRPIDKTIIVDDIEANFCLQRDNGVRVPAWRGDEADTVLVRLKPMLAELVQGSPQDIRVRLKESLAKSIK